MKMGGEKDGWRKEELYKGLAKLRQRRQTSLGLRQTSRVHSLEELNHKISRVTQGGAKVKLRHIHLLF